MTASGFSEEQVRRCAESVGRNLDQMRAVCASKFLRPLRESSSEEDVFKALRAFMYCIVREIKRLCEQHSRYYWLYHSRRHAIYHLSYWNAEVGAELDEQQIYSREYLAFAWHYRRSSLAALRFGRPGHAEMTLEAPKVPGTTGYWHPLEFKIDDVANALYLWGLVHLFEITRFCLKRLGKGGTFVWLDRRHGMFSVELEGDLAALVQSYDTRFTGDPNILKFFGSWAACPVDYYFPVAGETSYKSWVTDVPLEPFPKEGLHPLLDLIPNIRLRQSSWQGRTTSGASFEHPPTWLPVWVNVGEVLPRVELIRGVMKKDWERRGRPPYEPEELVLSLAALSAYERDACEKAPHLWQNPLLYGYSVFSGGEDFIVDHVLPFYQRIRIEFGEGLRLTRDVDSLLAVVRDLGWSEHEFRKIDIHRATPTKLFYPVTDFFWILDWTLMLTAFMDILSPVGRLEGAVSRLRGHDVEIIVGNQLSELAKDGLFRLWWRGREGGGESRYLRFRDGTAKDLDVGVICSGHVIAVEVKAFSQDRVDYVLGLPREIKRRWSNVVQPAIDQVDDLARLLAAQPTGSNFEIPRDAEWVVPVVCAPLPEWIPSTSQPLWLDQETPRVCTLGELIELMYKIDNGLRPSNRIRIDDGDR